MVFDNIKFVLCFLAVNPTLISSQVSILLHLLSVLLVQILQELRKLNNLRNEAIMARNKALTRYRYAKLKYIFFMILIIKFFGMFVSFRYYHFIFLDMQEKRRNIR